MALSNLPYMCRICSFDPRHFSKTPSQSVCITPETEVLRRPIMSETTGQVFSTSVLRSHNTICIHPRMHMVVIQMFGMAFGVRKENHAKYAILFHVAMILKDSLQVAIKSFRGRIANSEVEKKVMMVDFSSRQVHVANR